MNADDIELNRVMWDERVAIHVESAFYDVDSFREPGAITLRPWEVDEVGDVRVRPVEFSGTYADPSAATKHNASYQWRHGLDEILTSLLDHHLTIELFKERSETTFSAFDALVPRGPFEYMFDDPLAGRDLPLLFSLRARKDGSR